MINIEEFLDFAVNYLNQDGSNYVLFSLELPDKKCLSKKHYFISDEITSDILPCVFFSKYLRLVSILNILIKLIKLFN